MSIYSIILASGTGTRLPNDQMLPKQFLCLAEETIIELTLKQFLKSELFNHHIIVVQEDWYDHTVSIFESLLNKDDSIHIVRGDLDRQGSILKGLYFIKEYLNSHKDDIIVTHDAVRPFIFKEIIESNIKALLDDKELDGVDTVIPATDTIIYSEDGKKIHSVPNRDFLFHGQTPQSFRFSVILDILKGMSIKERKMLTDAIKPLIMENKKVIMIEGSSVNMKITTPEELILAKTFYKYLEEGTDGTYYL